MTGFFERERYYRAAPLGGEEPEPSQLRAQTEAIPTWRLAAENERYVPANATDIRKTFARFRRAANEEPSDER